MSAATTLPRFQIPHRQFRLYRKDALKLYAFLAIWLMALVSLPNGLWNPEARQVVVLVGLIGTWRYSWWVWNVFRSRYYQEVRFPAMRRLAEANWADGWRPGHVHILVTTYHEIPETTHKYLEAIVREVKRDNLKATLWVGLGAKEDEEVISRWMEDENYPNLEVVLVRQNQPGKRVAIGVTLRALSRRGVGKDDIAFLMDGDTILDQGAIRKCVSLFGADPELKALTSDEDALVVGPWWVQQWLRMRFAQRRMWMQSHALSNKVLTLTGRMSAFRASSLIDKELIRTVEADHLKHWLWGEFRFLSGDDKSTWYALLKDGARMTYVPDAMCYTIEYIEGNGIKRMRDNLLRWSGNMLRNGARAIALGPKRVGWFIWYCLLDQRIAIWTVLAGFTASMAISIFITPAFLVTYFLWIALSRLLISTSLFMYSDRIYLSYPFFLYVNQLVLAFIKVYMLFRLPKQRWANRKSQRGGDDVMAIPLRRAFATYMNVFYLSLMLMIVFLFTGILEWPYAFQYLHF